MKKGTIIAITVFLGIGVIIVVYLIFFKKKKQDISLQGAEMATCNSSFLFVGDSLTIDNNSYANQLKAVCPSLSMKIIAQVGAKTDWMLSQLQADLATGNKYDVISIWGGVNDIYATNSITSAEANLQAMYTLAKQSGATVVALTVIPTRTYTAATDYTVSLTNQLNDWIFANKTIDGLVDANGLVNNGNDGTLPQYLAADTLHLTPAGQLLISQDFVKDVINTAG